MDCWKLFLLILRLVKAHRRPTKIPPALSGAREEHSTALATATESTLQKLYEWNARYWQKFGFVFLIFASGRSTPEILAEIERRYQNRPIVELELAAKEQMKITELRLSKLFSANAAAASTTNTQYASDVAEVGDRVSHISGPLGAAKETPGEKSAETFTRTRPPITAHVLDIARGSPASGVEVLLEMWGDDQSRPLFGQKDSSHNWKLQGSSTTDKDGRCGQLMKMVDILTPGIYRISFDTGKYHPTGFFPYVSVVF